jgi:hypothetical protein
MIIFYCIRFETPPTWRASSPYLYPPGTVWPSYTSRHWVPVSSPPTTRRARVEVFDPASTRKVLPIFPSPQIEVWPRHEPCRKHLLQQLFYCCVCICYNGNEIASRCLAKTCSCSLFRLSGVMSHCSLFKAAHKIIEAANLVF